MKLFAESRSFEQKPKQCLIKRRGENPFSQKPHLFYFKAGRSRSKARHWCVQNDHQEDFPKIAGLMKKL
jgi:hypothetical protein